MNILKLYAATFMLIVLPVADASACSVPVFRYALELWPPDHYPLYLFHDGELNAPDQELLDRLNSAINNDKTNLHITLANIRGDLAPAAQAAWDALNSSTKLDRPLLVLHTPPRLGPASTVLSLELTAEHVDQLLDSPTRKEIAERIISGDSVVWVLLESGQAELDQAAFETLQGELTILESTLELPEPETQDLLSGDVEPLKLAFSILRLQRDDPAERGLVEALLRVEPDLLDPEFQDVPMVFPIFGRGRALYALVGDGISPGLIEEAARYLTGACQCTVKAENPGADLLMTVDWDRWITPMIQEQAEPTLSGLASFAEPVSEPSSPLFASSENQAGESAAPHSPTSSLPGPGTTLPGPQSDDPVDRIESVVAAEPTTVAEDATEGLESAETEVEPDLDQSAAPFSPSQESSPSLGAVALFLVGAIGIMVILAGIVLTRREA